MSQTPKKWLPVPSLLNKIHVDFWEGMHPNSWKIYDSIDHMVACGFLWHVLYDIQNFNKNHNISVIAKHLQIEE